MPDWKHIPVQQKKRPKKDRFVPTPPKKRQKK